VDLVAWGAICDACLERLVEDDFVAEAVLLELLDHPRPIASHAQDCAEKIDLWWLLLCRELAQPFDRNMDCTERACSTDARRAVHNHRVPRSGRLVDHLHQHPDVLCRGWGSVVWPSAVLEVAHKSRLEFGGRCRTLWCVQHARRGVFWHGDDLDETKDDCALLVHTHVKQSHAHAAMCLLVADACRPVAVDLHLAFFLFAPEHHHQHAPQLPDHPPEVADGMC